MTDLGPGFPFRCDRCGHEVEGGNLQGHPCFMPCRGWFGFKGKYRQIPWDDEQMHARVARELAQFGRSFPPRPKAFSHD